jgi:hypothetical protein
MWKVTCGILSAYYLLDAAYIWSAKEDPWALKSLLMGMAFALAGLRARSRGVGGASEGDG